MSVPPSPAFWIAAALYVVTIGVTLAALGGRERALPWGRGLLYAAIAAHAIDIGWRGVLHVHPAQSVRESLGFLSFIVVVGFAIASRRLRLLLGGVVVLPIALGLLLVARLSPVGTAPEDLTTLGRVHISLATFGVAVFALASVVSAIYLLEERSLRRKDFNALSFRSGGASLESLDRLSHRLVWLGFPIFTIAMILGVVWVTRRGASFDRPEYPIAMVTWLMYASLLITRSAFGWRGRRAANLTLLGFAAALIVLAIYVVRRVVGA